MVFGGDPGDSWGERMECAWPWRQRLEWPAWHAAGLRRKFQEAMTFQLSINGKKELLDEKPKAEKLRCRGWGHTGGCRGFGRVWSFRGAMMTSQGLHSSLAAQRWRLIVTLLG